MITELKFMKHGLHSPAQTYFQRKICNASLFILAHLFVFFFQACVNGGEDGDFLEEDPYPVEQGFHFTYPSDTIIYSGKYDAIESVNSSLKLAKKSIEIWCYGFDEKSILENLIDKRNAGISITITGSEDQDYSMLENEGFTVLRRTRSGLQHAKVILIDRSVLISGTGNFTKSGFFYNNNVFFIFRIPLETGEKISYAMNHEDIPSGKIDLPYNGRMILSPARGRFIQSRIVRSILDAKYRIRYMIFSHTDQVITDALYRAAKRGVLVEGIYDSSGFSEVLPEGSESEKLNRFSPWNMMIYLDGNRSRLEISPGNFHGGHLHHKTLIIDDSRVLTGSYNWSMSARDSNLEAFYEFHDPYAASIFTGEFSRIQNAALYIPPNLYKTLPSQTDLIFDEKLKNFCWSSNIPDNGFTIFSGKGIYFRAERFSPSLIESGCIPEKDRDISSAGPFYGNTHILSPDIIDDEISDYVLDMNIIKTGAHASMPCDNAKCRPLFGYRASIHSGWIWTDAGIHFKSYRIWNSDGMSEENIFPSSAPGLYEFTPGTGDALIFMRDVSDQIYAACIRDGLSLNGSIKYFVDAFNWESGSELTCIEGE